MKISIIMPVYNSEKYLSECIDSVICQSYKDYELIIINDGSTDLSGKICDEYARQYDNISVFHTENKGVSAARNLGLRKSKGEYIAFIDSDDYVSSDWLDNFINVLSDEDIIIQGFYWVNSEKIVNKSFLPDYERQDKTKVISDFFCNDIYGYLFVKMFKKKIIDEFKIEFDENSVFQEDEQFLSLFLENANKIRITHQYGYFYRMPDYRTYKKEIDYSLLYILKSFYKIYSGDIPKAILEKRYNSIRDYIGNRILQRKHVDELFIAIYSDTIKKTNNKRLTSFILKRPNNFLSYFLLKIVKIIK